MPVSKPVSRLQTMTSAVVGRFRFSMQRLTVYTSEIYGFWQKVQQTW